MNQTLWATPERQMVLDVLRENFLSGKCSFGHTDCPTMRKIQQAIVDKIGLPGEDVWFWVMRAAQIVGVLSADLPKIPPIPRLPIVYHGDMVITGVSPMIVGGGIGFERRERTPQPQRLLTQDELRHLPTRLFKSLVDYWKADDREGRAYLRQLEKRHMHALPVQVFRGA